MEEEFFDRPVVVFVGLSMPVQLQTLEDMRRFLDDWPPSRRNLFHDRACAVCRSCATGTASLQSARRAFVTFARQVGILFTDDGGLPATVLRTAGDAAAPLDQG